MSQILNGAINIKDGMSDILTRISKKLNKLSQEMPSMITNIDRAVGSMSSKLKKHEADIAAHQNRMLTNMKRNQDKFIQYIHRTPQEIDRMNAKMASKARSLAMHQQNISMGFASAGLPGAYVGYKGAKSFGNFDQTMADLRAKTLDNFAGEYKRQAINLGMSSRYSPTEVGKAQIVLAKAGYSGNKLLNTSPSVVNMASANDMTMEDASAAMIAAKNTFQLGDNVKDLNKVVDMLSYTANKTNADVKGLITSMNYSGATAKSFGMSLEENIFFSGKLKDFGMGDSTVGTSMNQFVERLLTNDDAQKVLKEKLGVDIYNRDKKGNPLERKNIFDIISGMRNGMEKLNIEQGPKALKDIAETRGFRAISRILSIDPDVLEKSRQEFMDYENIRGYAEKMQLERLKSFIGQIEKLVSGFDSMTTVIGELAKSMGLLTWLTEKTDSFEQFIKDFMDYNEALEIMNGNVNFAKILLGDRVWKDSLQFIIGFRQGIEDVFNTIKNAYNEFMKFLGVFTQDNSVQKTGQMVAHFIGYSMLLTPLGIGLLFVKNITMGVYSSFAMLGGIMAHTLEGVSKVSKIFSGLGNVVKEIVDIPNIDKTSSSKKGGVRASIQDIVNEIVGETTGNAIGQKSRMNDHIDFFDVNGNSMSAGLGSKQEEKVKNIVKSEVGDFLATSTGIGTNKAVGDYMSKKSKSYASITDLSSDAIGVSGINDNTFTGSKQAGKFGSNNVASAADKLADAADTINDTASISANTPRGKIKDIVDTVLDTSLNAQVAAGAGSSSRMISHLPYDVSSVAGGVGDRTFIKKLKSIGIGADGVNDEAKPKRIRDFLKDAGKNGLGTLGALGDNYLTAGMLGSTKAKDLLKGGAKGASSKARGLLDNLKLVGQVGLESIGLTDFGGGEWETDKYGKKKYESGAHKRKGMLGSKVKGIKTAISGAPDKVMDMFKNGFAGFMAMLPGAMSILGSIVTTVLSPFALILGSITVIGTALFLMLKKDGESWGEMFGRILKNITDIAMFLWTEVFVPFGKGLAESFGPTITMIQEAFVAMGERLAPMFKRIAAMFSGTEEGGLGKNMKYIGEIAGWALNFVLLPAINLIITALETLIGFLGDVIELFTSLATGNFSNFGRTLFRMFARLITGIFQLLATSVGSIIQMIPGMKDYGSNFIKWSKENLDAEKWTNNVFGEGDLDKGIRLSKEAKAMGEQRKYQTTLNKSLLDVQGLESKKQGGWSDLLSEIRNEEKNQSTMSEEERQKARDLRQIAANTNATAKNTGKDCETTLDGKKVSKNQERHQAINRQQGSGRTTLRNSKLQGRVQ